MNNQNLPTDFPSGTTMQSQFQEKLVDRLNHWLVRVIGFLVLIAMLYALQHWSLAGRPRYELFGAILLSLALTFSIGRQTGIIHRCSTRVFLTVIMSLLVLLRFGWIMLVPTLPISDFATYHRSASAIAQGVFEFPAIHRGGYPLLLGSIYRLFGADTFTAKMFNVLLSIIAALLIFWIARNLFDEPTARVGTLLFTFWPAQIMMGSVLATELPYTVLFLSAIAVLLWALHSESRAELAPLGAGILLGFSNPIRPASGLVIAIIVIWILVAMPVQLGRRLVRIALLVSGFAFVMVLYLSVRGSSGNFSALTALLPADNLLQGTNSQSKGMWNAEDSRYYTQLLNEHGAVEAQRMVMQKALERITSNPGEYVALLFEKFNVMWGDDLYGTYWSTASMDSNAIADLVSANVNTLYAISQWFYVSVLALSSIGCYRLRQQSIPRGITLLWLILLAFVGMHSLIEVQSRFHYPWETIFLILAGYGAVKWQVKL